MRNIRVGIYSFLILVLAACGSEQGVEVDSRYYLAYEAPTFAYGINTDVVEFFSYSCIHCEAFAKKIENWQNQNNVNVDYVPVIWNDTTRFYAQVFYLIKDHPGFESIHKQLFASILAFPRTHSLDEKKIAIVRLLSEFGISPIEVLDIDKNEDVQAKVSVAELLMKHFEIKATPSLVVHDQYRLKNNEFKSFDELLAMSLQLVQLRR